MIRHIVMFKLKDFATEADKLSAALHVKSRLDQLPKEIDLIRSYEAGVDVRHLKWSYDLVLSMDFDSMADLDAYTVHPIHQAFVAFNKDFTVEKACVDFEI